MRQVPRESRQTPSKSEGTTPTGPQARHRAIAPTCVYAYVYIFVSENVSSRFDETCITSCRGLCTGLLRPGANRMPRNRQGTRKEQARNGLGTGQQGGTGCQPLAKEPAAALARVAEDVASAVRFGPGCWWWRNGRGGGSEKLAPPAAEAAFAANRPAVAAAAPAAAAACGAILVATPEMVFFTTDAVVLSCCPTP